MKTKTLCLVAAGAAAVLLGSSLQAASAEGQYETGDGRLESERYETLRALARHLDETARGALEGAADDAQHRASTADARFLSEIRSFARHADDFQRMVDDHPASPFEMSAQVRDLTARASKLNERIRSAHALENTYSDWEAVLDVLERTRLLLLGRDVEVPAAHVVEALSGRYLSEFRQLAQDVEISATQAHARAKREAGDYPQRGQQFLGELYYLATQSRDLRSSTDAGRVDPQQIGPVVDRLLEDARQTDRRMRDAGVFTSIRDDSGRTITILQQMARLVRS
jgi:hypothetical protein